jgi:hypothetical protein
LTGLLLPTAVLAGLRVATLLWLLHGGRWRLAGLNRLLLRLCTLLTTTSSATSSSGGRGAGAACCWHVCSRTPACQQLWGRCRLA